MSRSDGNQTDWQNLSVRLPRPSRRAVDRTSTMPLLRPRLRSTSARSTYCVVTLLTVSSELADKESSKKFYKKVLDMGKAKRKCLGCDRAIHDNERGAFEVYVCCPTVLALMSDQNPS